jgi:hypothetical protein
MNQKADEQLKRIAESVMRLTLGTILDGSSVEPVGSEQGDRLKFRVTLPRGGDLLNCHSGILIYGLESWTDQSLDERLYQSSEPAVRHFLNKPNGASVVVEEESDLASPLDGNDRKQGVCIECRMTREEIKASLAELQQITQRGTSICRNCSDRDLEDYVNLLRRHLDLLEKIERTREQFALHRRTHWSERRLPTKSSACR